jgi:hypothetical protein
MILSEIIGDLWYSLVGRCLPVKTVEQFAPLFVNLCGNILPYDKILSLAKIELVETDMPRIEEYTTKIIKAHVAHLERYQSAHNSIQVIKVEKPYQRLHIKTMIASRAYGETLVTFLQVERLLLSPQYHPTISNKINKHGSQWDALTARYTRNLLDELSHIKDQEPENYKLLVTSEETMEGIEDIARFGTMLF